MISMNIIYLDTLFLVNFICDYTLLLCTARVGGAVIRRIPILISSALGGFYACICCFPTFSWMGHPLVKLACWLMLCFISFTKEDHLLRCSVIFLCISSMSAGLLAAISLELGNLRFIPIHLKTLLLAFAVIYYVLHIFFRNLPRFYTRDYHSITIVLNNKSVSFRALRDSGNELYDPITNRPVLICSTNCINKLFTVPPKWDADIYELFLQLNKEECQNRMVLIPCHTVTGSGMLLGFIADKVTIDGHTEPHIVAFSKERFKADAPYQAIY